MAERFRVLTVLAEDSGLVSNTHTSFLVSTDTAHIWCTNIRANKTSTHIK